MWEKNKEFVHQLNTTTNMASSEEHTFENEWRRRFDDASETPPPALWERIEARLDEEQEERVMVIPFWQRTQQLRWVAAASVTALLLAVGGWWLKTNLPEKSVAASTELAQQPRAVEATKSESLSVPPANQNEPKTSLATKSEPTDPEVAAETSTKVTREKEQVAAAPLLGEASRLVATSSKRNGTQKVRAARQESKRPATPALISPFSEQTIASATTQNATPSSGEKMSAKGGTSAEIPVAALSEGGQIAAPSATKVSPEMTLTFLENKQMRQLLGHPKRQPWVAVPSEPIDFVKPKQLPKEYWASVGVMPASYNAGVEIGGRGLLAASNTPLYNNTSASFNNSARASSGTNRSALSYAFQWQGGVQLSSRWSLESGINYLQGNSVYQGINAFSTLSNSYINSLESAVNVSDNNIPRYDFATIGSDKSLVQTLTTTQDISNSYQFLQVPVQTGFALIKPKRKFSLWLLGGFINNIFLKNSFQTGQDNTVTVSGNDSPYRRLSFAATTGMRLQYKVNKRWTTLLSGNYQRSVGSATRANAAFQARPQLMGVGAGVRYGF